jgi:hypothetical protein
MFCIFVVLIIIYYHFSPADSSFFIKCPFKALTGFDCPGCGSQRAIHCLLHFDISGAFCANPLLICALPYIVGGFYFDIFPPKTNVLYKIHKFFYGSTAIWTVFVIVIAYWIFRNIPA